MDIIEKVREEHPPDHVTSEGVHYWTAVKICPERLDFTRPAIAEDAKQFVAACAVLLAKLLAIAIPPEDKIVLQVATSLEVSSSQ